MGAFSHRIEAIGALFDPSKRQTTRARNYGRVTTLAGHFIYRLSESSLVSRISDTRNDGFAASSMLECHLAALRLVPVDSLA